MEIRRASLDDDFASFWECLDAVARERRFLAMLEAPPLDVAKSFLDDAFAQGMIQLVAVDGSRVVGWCDITPERWEGMRHRGRLGMGVLAAWRRRGIGSQLLVATLEAARQAGLRQVELDVYSSNRAAIALYERHGFMREGVKREARVVDGVVDDIICMVHILD